MNQQEKGSLQAARTLGVDMDQQRIARELTAVAKLLTAGTWGLPKDARDVAKIVKMVKRMREGDPPLPNKPRPQDAFHAVLGDDGLFDSFDSAQRYYYKECVEAVVKRVRELAKEPRNSYANPDEYDMILELAKQLR